MTEPLSGFPGDAEGAWAGEPGAVLEGGGQIASRGTGDLDPLHGQPSEAGKFEQWPPPDFGPDDAPPDAATVRASAPARTRASFRTVAARPMASPPTAVSTPHVRLVLQSGFVI